MPTTTHDLWQQLSDALQGFIQRRVNDPHAAEDLLQDVFLRIHGALPGLDDQQRVVPWVFRIARNAITDYYRKRGLSSEPLSGDEVAPSNDDSTDPQLSACVRAMINTLPDVYSDALIAVDLKGQSQIDFAQAKGLAPTTARSRVQRGRQKLKADLLACCEYEFDRLGQPLNPVPDRCDQDCGCKETNEDPG